jgi:hypothetical protein
LARAAQSDENEENMDLKITVEEISFSSTLAVADFGTHAIAELSKYVDADAQALLKQECVLEALRRGLATDQRRTLP